MKNIVISEIFKNLKSCYFRICFFGGCLLTAAGTIFLPEAASSVDFLIGSVDDLKMVLPFVFIAASVALIVLFPLFTDIFKYDTYKNDPPSLLRLPAAKYISVIFFMLFYSVVFMVSLCICIARLTPAGANPIKDMIICCGKFLAAIPNYMAIVAFIQFLSVIIKNEIAPIVIYYLIVPHMLTAKLIISAVAGDSCLHLTPVGELYNLGGNISLFHTVIGVVLGAVYTILLIKIVQKCYKKRVFA